MLGSDSGLLPHYAMTVLGEKEQRGRSESQAWWRADLERVESRAEVKGPWALEMTLDPGDTVSGNGDCCIFFSASDSGPWQRGYLVLAHIVFSFTRGVKGHCS